MGDGGSGRTACMAGQATLELPTGAGPHPTHVCQGRHPTLQHSCPPKEGAHLSQCQVQSTFTCRGQGQALQMACNHVGRWTLAAG